MIILLKFRSCSPGAVTSRRSKVARDAFTLIELLVVIGIIAVLASISLPIIASMQESGRSVKCISNLRQIGAALNLYANDHNNYYPALEITGSTSNWDTVSIDPYLPERNQNGRQSLVFVCPSASYKGQVNKDLSQTYSAAESLIGPNTDFYTPNLRSSFASQTGTLLLFDAVQTGTTRYCTVGTSWHIVSTSGDLQAGGTTTTAIDYRHRSAFHGLFADGHVDTIARAQASVVVTQTLWTGRIQ